MTKGNIQGLKQDVLILFFFLNELKKKKAQFGYVRINVTACVPDSINGTYDAMIIP